MLSNKMCCVWESIHQEWFIPLPKLTTAILKLMLFFVWCAHVLACFLAYSAHHMHWHVLDVVCEHYVKKEIICKDAFDQVGCPLLLASFAYTLMFAIH